MDFTMLVIVAGIVIPGYFIIYGLSKMLYSQADRFEEESKNSDELNDDKNQNDENKAQSLSGKAENNDDYFEKTEVK